MLSARLCKGKLPLQRSVCVFMNAACSKHRQLQQQMFANVQQRFSVHLNEIICSELPPSADFPDKKKAPTPPHPSSSSVFFLLPIKKQTGSQINPIPLQCSHPHPGLCQVGEIIGIVYPNTRTTPAKTTTTVCTHTSHLPPPFQPLLLPHPPPPSSPLQNEMPVSDRLSQFADPCGTHPFRPGHCASRSLAKRRGIIFIPQTRGYAPMISNACLAHCRGWFWPSAKPIILISLSLYFNSHRQCRFTAEHIREIKISLRR